MSVQSVIEKNKYRINITHDNTRLISLLLAEVIKEDDEDQSLDHWKKRWNKFDRAWAIDEIGRELAMIYGVEIRANTQQLLEGFSK